MDWKSMSADEAEALAAGMYAGEKAAVKNLAEMYEVWATIDWWVVPAIDADEKAVFENPAYLSIPF